ncbi:MAG: hypothetical protein ACRD25_01820, partial [Terracidiphilus sp.]
MAHIAHNKTLPAELGAPPFVDAWKRRGIVTGVVFCVIAAIFALLDRASGANPMDHLLRGWVLGMTLTWGFAVGGLALLMVQYCSGGKYGLLLRRPLEAMSRTLPLVFLYWVVAALPPCMDRLYLWARIKDAGAALRAGTITEAQAHCIAFKRPMLNIGAFWWVSLLCFAIWG